MKFSMTFLLNILLSVSLSHNVLAQKTAPPVLKLGDPLPANLFVELAKAINPAVVNISTRVKPRMNRGPRDPFQEMLEQFYGMPPQQQPGSGKTRPHSLGTGFIIREDGLIVTNNHVIAGADEIEIQLSEGAEKVYPAKVVGSDERTDVALIKIEGKGFPTVSLGSSADLQVGEWVAAFGNPFGQGHSMTKGIVSAKGRAISEINRFPLIQTDTPINPGNSGGPLVNSKGQVIGVNSAIDPRAQGIGFAIPIDEVKTLLPQLEKLGRIRKAFLGVQMRDIDPQAAASLGLKEEVEGTIIMQVEKNSPAARAGIKPYDIVTEINGKKIKSSGELAVTIADLAVGTTAKLKMLREGKVISTEVNLAERPEKATIGKPRDNKIFSGNKAPFDLGFTVADANAELKKEFQLEEDVSKPVIVSVAPGSVAQQSGILPGDVVLDVNRKEVKTAQEVTKQMKKGTNTFRLARQNSVIFVMVEAR